MLNKKALAASVSAPPAIYPEDVFATYLWTGNDSSRNITNGIDLAGKGGLIWIKARNSDAYPHQLFDSNRGFTNTNGNVLNTEYTSGGNGYEGSMNGVSSTGFSLTSGNTNASNVPYCSWTFRKQPKFFDVVTWTGDGTTGRQIPHNLGVQPGVLLYKRTDTTGNWIFQHRSLSGSTSFLRLNSTDAVDTGVANFSDATSTYFVANGSGNAAYQANINGATYVAYLFAHNAGGFGTAGTDNVISCGSFVTGSTGVETITLGYEPQYVMFKRADSTGDWVILDTMRGFPNGGVDAYLYANTSAAETTAGYGHPTATGFVIDAGFGSGQTYIYMAIRRPMKVPTTGTSVFAPVATTDSANTFKTTGFTIDLQMQGYRPGISNNIQTIDRLRGVGTIASTSSSVPKLSTSSTAAESSVTASNGWNNTGFQISSAWDGNDMVYWNFRRASGFFDVVCYTGTGSARTVAHNLTVAPELMIVKGRSVNDDWSVYSQSIGNTDFLKLNSTATKATGASFWNNTSPTSSVFSLGTNGALNSNGGTFVAYLFATCAGVSKVFSYTGNGSSQTINCAFTAGARFVMVKRTDSTGDWYVWDTARGIVSGNDPHLSLNTTAAEVTSNDSIDPDNSGFIVNQLSATNINVSSATYIGIAIA